MYAFRSQETDVSSRDAPPAAVALRAENIPHDLLMLHDPRVNASVVISLCSDPVRIEVCYPVNYVAVLGGARVKDHVPAPYMFVFVRKNLQNVPVFENRFHAGAGVGDVGRVFGRGMRLHHVMNGRT